MAAKKSLRPPTSPPRAEITVLAGVNGAGKSSIGGAFLRENGAEYFNPDQAARAAIAANPSMGKTEANAWAWQEGRRQLEAALAKGTAFTFETTLGGTTLTRLLLDGATQGAIIRIWYAGLESVELHLRRVAARVNKGGHNIPERDIRQRWIGSHANLIRLIPHVTSLLVYDNSLDRDPSTGTAPLPRLVLSIEEKRLTFPLADQLSGTPQWAKPIVLAAYQHFNPYA